MSEKAKDNKPITVEGAIVVPPQLADKILSIFGEMPRKYSPIIDPVVQEFLQCARADVVLNPSEKVEK